MPWMRFVPMMIIAMPITWMLSLLTCEWSIVLYCKIFFSLRVVISFVNMISSRFIVWYFTAPQRYQEWVYRSCEVADREGCRCQCVEQGTSPMIPNGTCIFISRRLITSTERQLWVHWVSVECAWLRLFTWFNMRSVCGYIAGGITTSQGYIRWTRRNCDNDGREGRGCQYFG